VAPVLPGDGRWWTSTIVGSQGWDTFREAFRGRLVPAQPESYVGHVVAVEAEGTGVHIFDSEPFTFTTPADGRVDLPPTLALQVSVCTGVSIRQDGRRARRMPGVPVLLRLDRPFLMQAERQGRHLTVSRPIADLAVDEAVLAWILARPLPATAVVNATVSFLLTLARELLDAQKPVLTRQLGRTLADLMAAVVRESTGQQVADPAEQAGNLVRIRHLVQQRLHDEDLDVAAIADNLGISVRYVHRLFETEETTVSAYIRATRLEAAAALLRDDEDTTPLSDIAAGIGFRSRDQFGRAFRAEYGLTPSEYRAAHAAARNGPAT
jgi:AraC-like DNA-binding protein